MNNALHYSVNLAQKKNSMWHDEHIVNVGACSSSGVAIQICYQTFGKPDAPKGVVLLIMGLASSSLLWDCKFCEHLAAQGYYVIRFDNRDIGRSTFLNGHKILPVVATPTHSTLAMNDRTVAHANGGVVVLGGIGCVADKRGEDAMHRPCSRAAKWLSKPLLRALHGGPAMCMRLASASLSPGWRTLQEVYTLEDMAKDAIGLLDVLNIPRAHVIGMCMGGMIAQIIAIQYPTRVESLGLISTHSSSPESVWPSLRDTISIASTALRLVRVGLDKPREQKSVAPTDEEEELLLSTIIPLLEKFAGGSNAQFSLNADAATRQLRRILHRSCDFSGVIRQYIAMLNAPSRVNGLRRLNVPTTILHGTKDPLVPFTNAKQLAKIIPGATLLSINGLGHVLHPTLRSKFVFALDKNMQRSKGVKTPAKL